MHAALTPAALIISILSFYIAIKQTCYALNLGKNGQDWRRQLMKKKFDRLKGERVTTTQPKTLTRPYRLSFENDCDHLAYYCLSAFDTGTCCARSMFAVYNTFKNYCMMDYINCMEKYEVWEVVHMGECLKEPDPFPWHKYKVYGFDKHIESHLYDSIVNESTIWRRRSFIDDYKL